MSLKSVSLNKNKFCVLSPQPSRRGIQTSHSNKKNNSDGFVILYAVIITTVGLLVGVSLMNIMTKQLVLSSISRNAKVSYYAALAGRDCAEFWKKVPIDNLSFFSQESIPSPAITCFGDKIEEYEIETEIEDGVTKITTIFKLDLTFGTNKVCSKVKVVSDDSACEANRLLISSEGYNDSCANTNNNKIGPRLVRSIYKDKVVTNCSSSD